MIKENNICAYFVGTRTIGAFSPGASYNSMQNSINPVRKIAAYFTTS
ncbi:MAG TPA: hypothetical protein VHO28_05765 [Ignavibacteriales bacterium]|nr:hypothetical protein [Ignavibacteriales bacterium]